jgi:tetratricopeptide (TPR) repeat protein
MVLLLSCLTAGSFYYLRRTHVLSVSDTIVLAEFVNKTGDPIFDETLRRILALQFRQTPYLNFVSGNRIQQALVAMHKPPNSPLTSEVPLGLCRETGSKAYVTGVIESSNSAYNLSITVINCLTGRTLAGERVQATTKESVLAALSQASRKIREELGESAASIQRFDTPLDAAAPSLDSLHAYALGLNTAEGRGQHGKIEAQSNYHPLREQLAESYNEAAVPFFQQAIRFDPDFAMAYASLAKCYWDVGANVPATETLRKAYELREQLGIRDRFAVDTAHYMYQPSFNANNLYHLGVTPARYEKVRQVYKDWVQTYLRDSEPHRGLGLIYLEIGQPEKSLQEFREAMQLEPDVADPINRVAPEPYPFIVSLQLNLNHLSEATAQLADARSKDFAPAQLHSLLYNLAFLKGDFAGMAREVTWASTAGARHEYNSSQMEADTSAYYGKLENARRLLNRATEIAKDNHWDNAARQTSGHEAVLECLFGEHENCRRLADKSFDKQEFNDEVAFALALGGEISRPESYVEKWEKQFVKDPSPELWWPLIRSQTWLNRNDSAKAIEILKDVNPYELRGEGAYCVYIRGYANWIAPHLDSAEADFQEILDHPGVLGNLPVGALARVGLARVRASRGDIATAKSAYEDFFRLWKDADPDIPILKQAKAEYAKLQ